MTKYNEPYEKPSGYNVYLVTWIPEDGPLEATSYVVAPDMAAALKAISENPNAFRSVRNLAAAIMAKAEPAQGGQV